MTDIIDLDKLRKRLTEMRKQIGLNHTDLEHAIRNNYPGIKIASATIGRFESGKQKNIYYDTIYYWNSTLEKLISQKNVKNLATGESNRSEANPYSSRVL